RSDMRGGSPWASRLSVQWQVSSLRSSGGGLDAGRGTMTGAGSASPEAEVGRRPPRRSRTVRDRGLRLRRRDRSSCIVPRRGNPNSLGDRFVLGEIGDVRLVRAGRRVGGGRLL